MNILITGASRGIGFEVVRGFASNGKHTTVAISRNHQGLDKLRDVCGITNSDFQLYPIVFDLSSGRSFKKELIPKVMDCLPKIDVLIINAGFLSNKSFSLLSDSDIDQMVGVNFTSAAKLIRDLMPMMNTPSHVVSIGSMGGFQGSSKFPGLAVYSASKAALGCLTECLAEEYKDSGISFNCLALGAVNTEMLAEAFPGYTAPLSANLMAKFIVDFAINGNKFFNGKILPISLSTP
jgi:3-oxoacyl-[acyl-carrier protein] reductase